MVSLPTTIFIKLENHGGILSIRGEHDDKVVCPHISYA